MCQEGHVYHQPQLGKLPTCTYEELQITSEGMEDSLHQYGDEEFVQHPLCLSQVLYMQDERR